MTACLPRSFSSDFMIKSPDCFSSSFFLFLLLQTHSLSSCLTLSIIPLFSISPSSFTILSTFLFLFISVFISFPLLPFSTFFSMCIYIFVKIYRSPAVPPHSHACSVRLSHWSVHKTLLFMARHKRERRERKKREIFFCSLKTGRSDLTCNGLTFEAPPFHLAFCFSFALVTSDTKAILS